MSRETDLADGLVTAIDGQTIGGQTCSASRSYFLSDALADLDTDETDGFSVVALPFAVEDDPGLGDRIQDVDVIAINMVVLARVGAYTNAALDPWADIAEAVQKFFNLLTNNVITSNSREFRRRRSATRPTVWDSAFIRESGVFASQVVCQYLTGVDRE